MKQTVTRVNMETLSFDQLLFVSGATVSLAVPSWESRYPVEPAEITYRIRIYS